VGMEAPVDFCGIVSGRDADKFAAAGLTAVPGSVVDAPLVAECPFNVECRVVGIQEMGEYRLVMGEIVETHADEGILTPDGKMVDVGLLDPVEPQRATRVVDQRRQAPGAVDERREPRDVVVGRQVRSERLRAGLGGERLEPVRPPCDGDHVPPVGAQPPHGGRADAARRAGHDRAQASGGHSAPPTTASASS